MKRLSGRMFKVSYHSVVTTVVEILVVSFHGSKVGHVFLFKSDFHCYQPKCSKTSELMAVKSIVVFHTCQNLSLVLVDK